MSGQRLASVRQNTLDTIIGGCLAAYENDPAYTFENLIEDLKELGKNDIQNLTCSIPHAEHAGSNPAGILRKVTMACE